MNLTILERILILQALPPHGNVITLRIVRDLKGALAPSEEEIKKFNIRMEGDMTYWDDDKYEADIPIGEKATDVIVEALKKMNSENKLTEQHLQLYEKYVETKK